MIKVNKKLKHLEMLQNIINRFSTNSFTLKGMNITLITVIFSFLKDNNIQWIIVMLLLNLTFWILDFYYLKLEKYYRSIFDIVRSLDENEIDFFMGGSETKNTKYPNNDRNFFKVFFSISMLPYMMISFLLFISIISKFSCVIEINKTINHIYNIENLILIKIPIKM